VPTMQWALPPGQRLSSPAGRCRRASEQLRPQIRCQGSHWHLRSLGRLRAVPAGLRNGVDVMRLRIRPEPIIQSWLDDGNTGTALEIAAALWMPAPTVYKALQRLARAHAAAAVAVRQGDKPTAPPSAVWGASTMAKPTMRAVTGGLEQAWARVLAA
jgi:hypothetical protein